jgi:hypothetical protein
MAFGSVKNRRRTSVRRLMTSIVGLRLKRSLMDLSLYFLTETGGHESEEELGEVDGLDYKHTSSAGDNIIYTNRCLYLYWYKYVVSATHEAGES